MTSPPIRPNDLRLRLPVGTVLDNAFTIENEIGAGGFGITYLGRDRTLGHLVAIKEYFPAEIGSRDRTMSVHPASQALDSPFLWGRDGFLREAKLLAGFKHPNIVRVNRYFEANNTAYMALEYEEGQSLGRWLAGVGRRPTQAEIDRILMPLCDALEAIHAQRLVHRDIAPDNIIIRPDGSPVLLDFGAARYDVAEHSRLSDGPLHTTSYAVIKAHYSPIEQRSTDITRRGPWSDIYSLGATLYFATTGTKPPDANDRLSIDRDPLVPAADAGAQWRPSFLAAVDHALALKPGARPQTVRAFREEAMADPAKAATTEPPAPVDDPSAKKAPEPKPRTASFSSLHLNQTSSASTGLRRWKAPVIAAAALALLISLGVMARWLGASRIDHAGGGSASVVVPAESAATAEAERQAAARIAEQRREVERLAAIVKQEQDEARRLAAETDRLRKANDAAKASEAERGRQQAEAAARDAQAREAAARDALQREQAARIKAEQAAAAERVAAARRAAASDAQYRAVVDAQSRPDATAAASVVFARRPNTYVEGDGYDVTFKATFDSCQARCRADNRCQMFELYKPAAKCNLFDTVRKTGTDTKAEVGIKSVVSGVKSSAVIHAPDGNAGFNRYANVDMYGGDIQIIKETTLAACESACTSDARCIGYSFDRWNNSCYPKSTVGEFNVDARSVTVLRSAVSAPALSSRPVTFEVFRNRAFPRQAASAPTAASFEDCQARCDGQRACVALSYFKASRQCHLFATTTQYFSDPEADSAAKHQATSGSN